MRLVTSRARLSLSHRYSLLADALYADPCDRRVCLDANADPRGDVLNFLADILLFP